MDLFWDRFQDYVRSYLPQWRYDPDSGEPEAAFMRAAAELIQSSEELLARLPQKHELEFLRGWPLEPLEADPRYAYGAMTAPEGQMVGAGEEFYLSGSGERLWRTEEDAQAEPARLTEQFLTSGGKWVPLPLPAQEEPVRLFDLRGEGVPGPEVRFSHPDAFASQTGCQVLLSFPEARPSLLERFGQSDWVLARESGDTIALERPVQEEITLRFQLPAAPDGIALQVSLPPQGGGSVGTVKVFTTRLSQAQTLVWDGEGFCTGESWLPFGEAPEVWRTCCLSCPEALGLRGARVTVSFALADRSREDLLPGMDREPEYRPVMRRLPSPPPEIRDVWVDQVIWEYWNGKAWFPIPGTERYTGMFAGLERGAAQAEAGFIWPKDAAPCEAGGQTGFWLRWRVARAGNNSWLPRRCHAPEVAGLRVSSALENAAVTVSVRGRLEENFSPLPSPYAPLVQEAGAEGDCWWLGFDRSPSGQPLRLYLSLRDRVPGGRLTAWEPAGEGRERPLRLEDGTDGLAHSGVIAIYGAQGQMETRFHLRRWWLCLRDESGRLAQGRRFPCLEELSCGAVCLRGESGETCQKGEPVSPFRGGVLRGVIVSESFGGAKGENRAGFLVRARKMRHCRGRCVSALDVEQMVCGSFRDVLRTRCLREGDVLYTAVLMRDVRHHEAAFARRQKEICRLLEHDSALPVLGLGIVVREPVFYPVSVTVWLRPVEDVSVETLQGMANRALDRFLHPAAGHFRNEGWQIGRMPAERETGSYLKTKLPKGTLVRLLLTVTCPDGQELDCAQLDDPFALPLPGAHTIHMI